MKKCELEEILHKMAGDKNIKFVSVEMKRTTAGIKMEYQVRIGDGTRMGMEFVDNKNITNDSLGESKCRLLDAAKNDCVTNESIQLNKQVING